MKHIKTGIFIFLLLVGFLLISCDAMINTNDTTQAKQKNATPEEIHASLIAHERTSSLELAKAHSFEQEKQAQAKQNNSKNASKQLPSQNLESEMMKAANTEFQSSH